MGPGDLAEALCGLQQPPDPNLLIGFGGFDDAGVYKISDDLALIQTVDFFTPIVDDPRTFGNIAAANALSDIYAMGGTPRCAMNIVGFPKKSLPLSLLRAVLEGGLEKLNEAGVALAGGHSIDNPQLVYGLSVSGTAHPAKILANSTARPGDTVILTKALGVGIIATAHKAGQAAAAWLNPAVASMSALNRTAAELMVLHGAHAATDVTGFGLAGHLHEVAAASGVGIEIDAAALPLLDGVADCAARGLLPGGLHANRKYFAPQVEFEAGVEQLVRDIAFDPQTSGGLLIFIAPEAGRALLEELHQRGITSARTIGRVIAQPAGRVLFKTGVV